MEKSKTFSKGTWSVVLVIGLIGLIFLFKNHTSHVLIALPYLILLACPLMHLFMHKGHGEHGDDSGRNRQEPDQHNH
jgi:hypothetical protein